MDKSREVVLLPIGGCLVPFHISTVKTVTSQQDNKHSFIRIIFNVPGLGYSPTDRPMSKHAEKVYLKEASFRSKDSRHAAEVRGGGRVIGSLGDRVIGLLGNWVIG